MPISDSPVECLLDMAWGMAAPILARHPRMADGIDRRRLKTPLPRADLWIHAASVGEAYLAVEALTHLAEDKNLSILTTAVTRQGYDILAQAAERISTARKNVSLCRENHPESGAKRPECARIHAGFFPFDAPRLMDRAVNMVRPRAVVLLETEIWPGLLSALKRKNIPCLMVNARMSARSRKGYRFLRSFLRERRPSVILPVSAEYAENFAAIFGSGGIRCMPNIKFDRIRFSEPPTEASAALARLKGETPFLVLGSVREEEEAEVFRMIDRVRRSVPESVIGLFPRHLHRVSSWQKRLTAAGIPCRRRSSLFDPSDLSGASGSDAAAPGSVVIWDVFGELGAAYHKADAAFIGGSLAPMGGQNFMEALGAGISPVMGPSCYHFAWAGEDFFTSGLVRRAGDAISAADLLISDLRTTIESDQEASAGIEMNRSAIRRRTEALIAPRQGGTIQAVDAIRLVLELTPPAFPPDSP